MWNPGRRRTSGSSIPRLQLTSNGQRKRKFFENRRKATEVGRELGPRIDPDGCTDHGNPFPDYDIKATTMRSHSFCQTT